MNQGESSGDVPRLIALERSNQVPFDGELWKQLLLLKRLLNPVLTDVPNSGRHRSTHCFWAMGFGDCNDFDLMTPPASLLVSGHRFTHSGQPSRKAWEVHNPLIYQGMLRY
jgi:hypothetical protein